MRGVYYMSIKWHSKAKVLLWSFFHPKTSLFPLRRTRNVKAFDLPRVRQAYTNRPRPPKDCNHEPATQSSALFQKWLAAQRRRPPGGASTHPQEAMLHCSLRPCARYGRPHACCYSSGEWRKRRGHQRGVSERLFVECVGSARYRVPAALQVVRPQSSRFSTSVRRRRRRRRRPRPLPPRLLRRGRQRPRLNARR